ncbi:hypothetical protein GBA52_023403 [Prunus armeniaca]|nr:hypothetical protein GBA52_023403 [Prunus armeniaca]
MATELLWNFKRFQAPTVLSQLDADLMLMAAEAGPTDVIDIRFDGHICNLKREAEVFGGLGVVEFRMYKISGRKARWKGRVLDRSLSSDLCHDSCQATEKAQGRQRQQTTGGKAEQGQGRQPKLRDKTTQPKAT